MMPEPPAGIFGSTDEWAKARMGKTEFPPAIKSRPVYGVLEARPGSAHLLIADGEGALALVEVLAGRRRDAGAWPM